MTRKKQGTYTEKLILLFCTNTSSKFVAAITENPKTRVYFYSRKLVCDGLLELSHIHFIQKNFEREIIIIKPELEK